MTYKAGLEADDQLRLDTLEGLLDSTDATGPDNWSPTASVRALLEQLAEVCGEKAEWVEANHGSKDPDARAWTKAAKLVETAAWRLVREGRGSR